MLLQDRRGRGEGRQRGAKFVTDVTRETRVAFNSLDEPAHHGVERFGELLHLTVGLADDQTRREFTLGDQGRRGRNVLERSNGTPGHPETTTDADERREQRAR